MGEKDCPTGVSESAGPSCSSTSASSLILPCCSLLRVCPWVTATRSSSLFHAVCLCIPDLLLACAQAAPLRLRSICMLSSLNPSFVSDPITRYVVVMTGASCA